MFLYNNKNFFINSFRIIKEARVSRKLPVGVCRVCRDEIECFVCSFNQFILYQAAFCEVHYYDRKYADLDKVLQLNPMKLLMTCSLSCKSDDQI